MSYVSDWKTWEENAAFARAANPLCDETIYCPAPNDGHLSGCKRNRIRLGIVHPTLIEAWYARTGLAPATDTDET